MNASTPHATYHFEPWDIISSLQLRTSTGPRCLGLRLTAMPRETRKSPRRTHVRYIEQQLSARVNSGANDASVGYPQPSAPPVSYPYNSSSVNLSSPPVNSLRSPTYCSVVQLQLNTPAHRIMNNSATCLLLVSNFSRGIT